MVPRFFSRFVYSLSHCSVTHTHTLARLLSPVLSIYFYFITIISLAGELTLGSTQGAARTRVRNKTYVRLYGAQGPKEKRISSFTTDVQLYASVQSYTLHFRIDFIFIRCYTRGMMRRVLGRLAIISKHTKHQAHTDYFRQRQQLCPALPCALIRRCSQVSSIHHHCAALSAALFSLSLFLFFTI